MKIFAADYVLPISSDPIEDGAVVIEDDKIVAVGEIDPIITKFPDAELDDLGEAAILPGFVNCHSHLELTLMRGALDEVEHDFSAWLLRLNEIRASMSKDDLYAAALTGVVEGINAGVTCFGDIGRFGSAGFEALKTAGIRGVMFQETEFSADDRTAEDDFRQLVAKVEEMRRTETDLVKVGISPHSPYTVGPKLLKSLADYAVANRVKLSIHASESVDENELLIHGTGFFRRVYEKYGVEWQSPHCSPIEYLDRLGVLRARPLLAHCVNVSDSDIELIAQSGSTVAHCPKSNAKFGHGYAPLEDFLDQRIPVGIGSDSVASNNVCDMLEESRFASFAARNRAGSRRFLTAKEMLEVATLGGAEALGLDHLIGSLVPGKQADLTVVMIDGLAQMPVNDIHAALVFSSNAHDIAMTMVAGTEVFRIDEDE